MFLQLKQDSVVISDVSPKSAKVAKAPSWVIELLRKHHESGSREDHMKLAPITFAGGLKIESNGFISIGNRRYRVGTIATDKIYHELARLRIDILGGFNKEFYQGGFRIEFTKHGSAYVDKVNVNEHKDILMLAVALPEWASQQIIGDKGNFPSLKFNPFDLSTSCKSVNFKVSDTGKIWLGEFEFNLSESIVSRLFMLYNQNL